jgi:hypothetical protein
MSDDNKPREFWIYDSGTTDGPVWEDEPEDTKKCIHVIEYQYYAELKALEAEFRWSDIKAVVENYKQQRNAAEKENEELKAEIEKFKTGINNFKCQNCGDYCSPYYPVNLMAEIASLRESLKLAVEALAFECGNRCAVGLNECNARETLAKIKAKHTEL